MYGADPQMKRRNGMAITKISTQVAIFHPVKVVRNIALGHNVVLIIYNVMYI